MQRIAAIRLVAVLMMLVFLAGGPALAGTSPSPPETAPPEAAPAAPAPGEPAVECAAPVRWVEVSIQDGDINIDVNGPGAAESADWAVISVHSNGEYAVNVEPDSYFQTRDGLTLGRAANSAGDEIGYYLLVKPWPGHGSSTLCREPYRHRENRRTTRLALGVQSAGNYTPGRTLAKAGQYTGRINVYAYVLN